MSLDRVPAGDDVPNDCNVIIEIPMHGEPIKYEVDKETGAVFVDRFMSTSMHYPCNYGYIPQTLSDDGDPVRRARALAGAADHRRRRALPADRHAENGRRGRRRREDPRRADRQAVVPVPVDRIAARPAGDPACADRAFLRALQGPRAGQVGPPRRLGRSRGSASAKSSTACSATGRSKKRPGLAARPLLGLRASAPARASSLNTAGSTTQLALKRIHGLLS